MTDDDYRIIGQARSRNIGRNVEHLIREAEVVQVRLDKVLEIQVFGALGAHTPAVFWEDAPQLRTWLSGLTAFQLPRIYIDVADRDREEILLSTLRLEKILAELAVPHEFYRFVGLHNAEYWSSNLERYLRWYSAEWGE